MKPGRVLLAGLAVALLWVGWRALASSRLDRDLLTRGLSQALGQPVSLQGYELSWDGDVSVSELRVGDFLKVRKARTRLPWSEVIRGQIKPRRLRLADPELDVDRLPAAQGPPPPREFPIEFAGATVRWGGHPPLSSLAGEWGEDGKLAVSHPQGGRWSWDGQQLQVEDASLKFLADWLGRPLPVAATDKASGTFVKGPPWVAQLQLPYGNVTLKEDPEGVQLESPRVTWQGHEVKEVKALVRPSRTGVEVLSASALLPWGAATGRGSLGAEGVNVTGTCANVQVTAKGPWGGLAVQARAARFGYDLAWSGELAGRTLRRSRLEVSQRGKRVAVARVAWDPDLRLDLERLEVGRLVRQSDLVVRGYLERKGDVWSGQLSAPAGRLTGVPLGGLRVDISENQIRGQARWGGEKIPITGGWKDTVLQLTIPAGKKRPGLKGEVDLATRKGTLEVSLEKGTQARLAVEPERLKLLALEIQGVKLEVSGEIGLPGGQLKLRVLFQGQTLSYEGHQAPLTGQVDVEGSVTRPRYKLDVVTELPQVGNVSVKGNYPGTLSFGAKELKLKDRSLGELAGTVTGYKVELQRPLALKGAYQPKKQRLDLRGPLKNWSLASVVPDVAGSLTGELKLAITRQGVNGTLAGNVSEFKGYGLSDPLVSVQAVQPGNKPPRLSLRFSKPRFGEHALPPTSADLGLDAAGNILIKTLELECSPPQHATGFVTPSPLQFELRSQLKGAPLALLGQPVTGSLLGNLTVRGDASKQTGTFAGGVGDLTMAGQRLGSGTLSLEMTTPPLNYTCQGKDFPAGEFGPLAARYPGLKGAARFVATPERVEVNLEGMTQGGQDFPSIQAVLVKSAIQSLTAATAPPLTLSGSLEPLALQGNLTGQSLNDLIRLSGGKPNPDIGMNLAGPLQLGVGALQFEGTVQNLRYKGAGLGSGRLKLVARPELDGRLALDQPVPLTTLAAVGLAPKQLQNPLVGLLGQAVPELQRISVSAVRLTGSLDAPRLVPEITR